MDLRAAPTVATLTPPTQGRLLEFRLGEMPVAEHPFDPDRFRVSATFQTPSGRHFDVPGFWYQDFTRSLADNAESLSPQGAPEWRLRFLPTERGRHEVRVSVATNGVTFGGPVTLSFDVAAAAAPPQAGYVQIAANRRYFQTDPGAPLPLIGHCVCWHGRRGTYDYDDWFAALQQAGENYTRLWMAPWAFGIETEPDSRLNYDLRRAWQLDYVLHLAEQRGLYLMLCFDYHGMFEVRPDFWGGNNFWPRHPYNAANGGPCARQNDFFTSAEAKRLYQKRLRYLIARYGYSPNLLAWQFFNEIDNVYRYLDAADVAAWHAEMGAWLKQHDPWKHLVTTSLTGGSDREEIWRLPELDFAMYHAYALPQPAAALPDIVHSFLDRYRKPVMIGEFGTDWRGWRREQDPWLRGWRQGIWAGALSGAVGTSMSWWWESIHAENLYAVYRALRDFMNRTHWGQGTWEPIAFKTNGDPPAQVGDVRSGDPPFTATLPLNGTWGAKPRGQLALADALSAAQAPQLLSSFVHGPAHAELRVPLKVHLWCGANARLTLHVNSVSAGAVMAVASDGRTLLQQSLPNRDGGSQVNNEYNEDFTVELPKGRQLIEVRNTGQDWFYLDWLRVENALPAEYADAWKPSPIATGLRGETESLLYVVSPHVN
jgi:hypothetical protein